MRIRLPPSLHGVRGLAMVLMVTADGAGCSLVGIHRSLTRFPAGGRMMTWSKVLESCGLLAAFISFAWADSPGQLAVLQHGNVTVR